MPATVSGVALPPPVVTLLLGAGASKDAGIPTTVEMTEAVISRLEDPLHVRGIEFIHYTLAADVAAHPRDEEPAFFGQSRTVERSHVDIERLFASVELLINRYDQPWSPFVAAWSPGLDSFSSGPVLRDHDVRWEFNNFERELQSALNALAPTGRGASFGGGRGRGARDVTTALVRGFLGAMRRARPTDVSSLLTEIRAEMLRSLFDVLSLGSPDSADYLRPLAELTERQLGLTVATLNYDRAVEEMCARAATRCDTGIETWLKGGELAWSERGLRLLKLHGSIDWVIDEEQREGELPFQRIAKLDPAAPTDRRARPAVVFGEAGKLRSEGPYLELLLAFADALKRTACLLVVGYSFRDQHVNEVIARWFSSDPTRRVVVVDPGELHGEWGSFASHLARLRTERSGSDVRPGRVYHLRETTANGLSAAVALASTRDPFPLPPKQR